MTEKIITDYLASHRRLVIPQVGAFLKKEDSELLFVPFLNKDDGVLAELIAQAYGLSAREADAAAARYSASITVSLAANGFYHAEGIGTLRKDVNGVLYLDTKSAGQERTVEFTAKPEPVVAADPEPMPAAKPAAPKPTPAPVHAPVHKTAASPAPGHKPPKKRMDWVMAIGIAVAVIVIIIVLYGMFTVNIPPIL